MANYIWDGGGSDNNWNTVDNWDVGSGFPDDNNDRAIFNGTSTKDCTVNVTTAVGRLSMDSGYSGTITLGAALTIDDAGSHAGSFELSQGTFTTSGSNYALTVDGHVSVTGTLTGNASAISAGSMIINSGGTYSATTGTTTINSEEASHAFRCSGGGTFTDNNGTLLITTPAETRLKMNGTGNVHHLTVNHASCTLFMESDTSTTIEGDLTITAGTVNTYTQGGSSRNFTVTGYCDVTGTLTLNDSAVSVGALRTNSGAAVTQGSSGTLALATGSNFGGSEGATYAWRNTDGTSDINLGGTVTNSGGSYFEPRTAPDYASVVNNVVWDNIAYWVGKMTFGGTLVVNASKSMEDYNGSKDVVVTGNVTVHGTLDALGNNVDNMTFGGLIIKSGGTYSATSGTTTIDDETGGKAYQNEGTFTHNNGTVLLHADIGDTEVYAGSSSLYNLTSSTGNNVWLKQNITIDNDLTVTSGTFGSGGGNDKTVTVHGNTFISGGQLGNGSETGAYTVKGLVTLTGGTFDLSSGTINLGGIRNAGGTIS